jgi:hypothetical protein
VLSRLDASTIVPGHGAAQHDHQYLTLVLDSLQAIADQVRQALDRGLTLSETLKAVHLESIRTSFTHDDPDLNAQFDGNFVPIVRQMYDEATEGLEQCQRACWPDPAGLQGGGPCCIVIGIARLMAFQCEPRLLVPPLRLILTASDDAHVQRTMLIGSENIQGEQVNAAAQRREVGLRPVWGIAVERH